MFYVKTFSIGNNMFFPFSESHECSICNKMFSSLRLLKNHTYRIHPRHPKIHNCERNYFHSFKIIKFSTVNTA